jgi:hypothetical protein
MPATSKVRRESTKLGPEIFSLPPITPTLSLPARVFAVRRTENGDYRFKA